MIQRVIAWWKRQPTWLKWVSAIGVGIILLFLVVGLVFTRGRVSESTVVDTAVDIHDRQSARRQEELNRLDQEGRDQVERADENLDKLKTEGQQAEDRREARNEEIRNADGWDDLDELGPARDRGRSGSR